jgi:hypothetical protein
LPTYIPARPGAWPGEETHAKVVAMTAAGNEVKADRARSAAVPLDFRAIPLGSLYEDRLVEDLLLLVEVVRACQSGDDERLRDLGV